MSYMRNKKGIQISGSIQKRKLRYMGYYHGYKGYRYCNSPSTLFPYKDFDELQAVYDFDMRIKAIIYPQIMFLETAMKNYALEIISSRVKSQRFADVYAVLLNDYKSHTVGSGEYKLALKKRMDLRTKIYSLISRDYNKNVVKHYYDKDKPVPIWAIFELLSLGEFGRFLDCLNSDVRKEISKTIGIKTSVDGDGSLTKSIVYVIKDLRNAVAHNNTIFDTRFKTSEITNRIPAYISSETGIQKIAFNTIVDYVILISFLMKLLKRNKTDILSFIRQFEAAYEDLRKSVPAQIYAKIILTDTKNKLTTLKNFL